MHITEFAGRDKPEDAAGLQLRRAIRFTLK